MMWVIDYNLCRKRSEYVDSATEFMRESGADGTPGSRHMIHIFKEYWIMSFNFIKYLTFESEHYQETYLLR